jgi:adenosylcobinamide-phosphate synthase
MDAAMMAPSPWLLAAGVTVDALLGDPVCRWHPVRLIGGSIRFWEQRLRDAGLDGRGGGVLLCAAVSLQWLGIALGILLLLRAIHAALGWIFHAYAVYSLLALRDLLDHAAAVGRAADAGDLEGARRAVARLVGRDADRMDLAGCRRAAIESLAENFTDGVLSPIFWYALAGLPGLVLFKAASTLDSMVGYRTPRYLRFGWCSARWDDAMNWIPARLSPLLLAVAAALAGSGRPMQALRIAWRDHGMVPGPNSGWSEAAMAGALGRRLIGPIYAAGRLVTDVWIGEREAAPAGETGEDLWRARRIVAAAGALAAAGAIGVLAAVRGGLLPCGRGLC